MKRARFLFLLAICLVVSMAFGGTALASQKPYSMDVSGSGQSTTTYDWTIQKSADQSEFSLSVGQSQTVNYAITLDKGDGSTVNTVNGTLTLTVHWPNGIDVNTIKAYVQKKGSGSNWNKVSGTEQTVVSDQHYAMGTHKIEYSATVPEASGQYRVKFEVDRKQSLDDEEDESSGFSLTASAVNDTITVVDNPDDGGMPGSIDIAPDSDYLGTWPGIADDEVINYSIVFTNIANESGGSGFFENEASIQETKQSAIASVTVNVPAPTPRPTPNPTPKPKPKPRDRSTPTPVPTELDAASVALPRTGGLIEWEWIALAGGMLSGCGGGLYLLRRRRMKK